VPATSGSVPAGAEPDPGARGRPPGCLGRQPTSGIKRGENGRCREAELGTDDNQPHRGDPRAFRVIGDAHQHSTTGLLPNPAAIASPVVVIADGCGRPSRPPAHADSVACQAGRSNRTQGQLTSCRRAQLSHDAIRKRASRGLDGLPRRRDRGSNWLRPRQDPCGHPVRDGALVGVGHLDQHRVPIRETEPQQVRLKRSHFPFKVPHPTFLPAVRVRSASMWCPTPAPSCRHWRWPGGCRPD
jgi:hypothetical protein